MSRLDIKRLQYERRKFRTRSKFSGTADRPRLSVNISNRHIRVQLIDDSVSKTLAAVTTVGNKSYDGLKLSETAKTVGKEIAEKAKLLKIKAVVFDRGGLKYHGRTKALADAAREAGLEI